MHSITPCQRRISDRFPVASFVVNVPSNRLFEIVCTTDPLLLRPEYRGRRTSNNFFTSRSSGLLRAPAGHATYLVPAEQLKRFAGKPRLFYALASYDSPRGDDLKLSIRPDATDVPSIQLSSDFTGRSLDRARIRGGVRDGRYGGPTPTLTWGGDAIVAKPPAKDTALDYDDGFSPELWTSAPAATTSQRSRTPEHDEPPEPDIVYDEAGLGEAYGRPTRGNSSVITSAPRLTPVAQPEPVGFEDAAALRSARASYGRVNREPMVGGIPGGHEPPGAEHVRGFAHAAYGRRDQVGEPPGLEHVLDRASAAYGRRTGHLTTASASEQVRDGDSLAPTSQEPAGGEDVRTAAVTDASVPAASSDVPGRGVDEVWADDDDEPDLVANPGETGEPLTVRRKFEILLPVTAYESGDERYSAVLGDVDHQGLHWGLVLFTQRSGAIGKVLDACERRDPVQFRQTFGTTHADRLLQVTNAPSPDERLAPVANALLWAPEWMEKFRAAGSITAFQAAQNEVAIEHYFDRNLGFASSLGLMTDRALAMIFDRAIHMGIAGARRWILQAISPITDDAKRTAALAALGHADLAAFQRATGLEPTGRFGTQTHAALLAELARLGERAPFAVSSTEEMLDALVKAAAGRSFERRVRGLRTATTYTDAVQRVV